MSPRVVPCCCGAPAAAGHAHPLRSDVGLFPKPRASGNTFSRRTRASTARASRRRSAAVAVGRRARTCPSGRTFVHSVSNAKLKVLISNWAMRATGSCARRRARRPRQPLFSAEALRPSSLKASAFWKTAADVVLEAGAAWSLAASASTARAVAGVRARLQEVEVDRLRDPSTCRGAGGGGGWARVGARLGARRVAPQVGEEVHRAPRRHRARRRRARAAPSRARSASPRSPSPNALRRLEDGVIGVVEQERVLPSRYEPSTLSTAPAAIVN